MQSRTSLNIGVTPTVDEVTPGGMAGSGTDFRYYVTGTMQTDRPLLDHPVEKKLLKNGSRHQSNITDVFMGETRNNLTMSLPIGSNSTKNKNQEGDL